ncbi:Carbohydrate Esterase Family 4 protein [Trametes cinnabarina]|uniref:chitin deacetylase n=1 Tax=Pycnoporus cinnabarinus TaxID=5643 RepID=A0A060SMI9_PYCCI|nr:Carbohydrate Esterase Family 4 protein [Trametes cinnabarina]
MPSLRSFLLLAATAILSSTATFATALPHDHHDHAHTVNKRLPGTWYHPEGHAAYNLFRRGTAQTDGTVYAAVGTPQWTAGYPPAKPDPNALPKAWTDAYNAAVSAGKIPKIPPSTLNGNPVYPQGFDPNGNVVCSATYKCRNNDDIWDAPDGVWGASFDDGPLDTSVPLYQFLKQNNVHATHFMIGVNILGYPDEFKMAFEDNQDDIAVHTWTHPYMTTLTDLEVVGELGWTMEIIHNSTGGRLPKYWRPPYGDSDNRVSAIAKEVFGLTTVIWNQDTEDWSIGQPGGTTRDKVNASLKQWITGPKSPGLIILEHELSNNTVGAFIEAFPLIQQNGWKFVSIAQLDGGSPYSNSPSSTGAVTPGQVAVLDASDDSSSDSSSSSSAAPASKTSSASAPASSPSSGTSSGSANGNKAADSSSSTTSTASSQPSTTGGASQGNSASTILGSGLLTCLSVFFATLVLS